MKRPHSKAIGATTGFTVGLAVIGAWYAFREPGWLNVATFAFTLLCAGGQCVLYAHVRRSEDRIEAVIAKLKRVAGWEGAEVG